MITVENVSYFIKDKPIIQNISCQFEQGKMHIILGPNGAGKSTLIKLLSGELKPTSGTVLYENTKVAHISIQELAQFRAILSQNIELSFPLNVNEVVMMGRYPHFDGKPDIFNLSICEQAMQLFDVYALKNQNYLTLSGGEKQRVQFARVFAQIWQKVEGKSRLLLLDEPLTFLDIFYQYDLMKKVKHFMISNSDVTVIGVVHDINIAAQFSDKIMLLKDKHLFAYGDPQNVLTERSILDVFGVKVKNCFEFDKNSN